MTTPVYDVNYFIAKFEATKPEEWSVGFLESGGKKCALGQCGVVESQNGFDLTGEALALIKLLKPLEDGESEYKWGVVSDINDNGNLKFQQVGPRARILAALREIKGKQ